MCNWKSSIMPRQYECSVPPMDGSDLCVFHAPRKSSSEFAKRFNEQLASQGERSDTNPRFDFRGYVFPSDLALAVSHDHVSDPVMDVDSGEFSGDSLLAGQKAPQLVLPRDAEGDITFSESKIGNTVDLRGLVSSRSVLFEGTEIFGSLHLEFANMSTLDLRGALIWGDVWCTELRAKWLLARGVAVFGVFEAVGGEFSGGVSLSQAIIAEPYFNGCVSRNLLLNLVGDESTSTTECPSFSLFQRSRCGITLCGTHRAGATFWEFARQTFEQMPDTNKADAAHYHKRISTMSPLRFVDPDPHLRIGRLVDSWRSRRWKKEIEDGLDIAIPDAKVLAGLARNLRTTAREARRPKVLLKRIAGFVFQWLPDSVLLRWTTAYGASLGRLSATWIAVIGGLGLLSYLLQSAGMKLLYFKTEDPFTLGRALYFSMVTFTTLGYGDIVPRPGLGSALASLEAVIGGVVMAMTVVVIARRFMR